MHQSNLREHHCYGQYCLLFIISVKQSYRLLSLYIFYKIWLIGASLIAQLVKNLPAVQETQVGSLGQEGSPGEGNGYPLQHSCLENPRQRSLVGCSPWGHKQSGTTEGLTLHFIVKDSELPSFCHMPVLFVWFCTYREFRFSYYNLQTIATFPIFPSDVN